MNMDSVRALIDARENPEGVVPNDEDGSWTVGGKKSHVR